jgi:hypothetical protein
MGIARSLSSVHLPLDAFREFVISGFRNHEQGWNDETQRQLGLARSSIVSVAKNYLEDRFKVVIDDAVFPNWDEVGIEHWKGELSPIEINLVVLMPNWDVVLKRNSQRQSDRKLSESTLRAIYDDMVGWRDKNDVAIIDNSNLTVSETVGEIDRVLMTNSEDLFRLITPELSPTASFVRDCCKVFTTMLCTFNRVRPLLMSICISNDYERAPSPCHCNIPKCIFGSVGRFCQNSASGQH